MTVDLPDLAPRDAYAWMTALIVPRPIAWISTRSASGVDNLAPYSFFQGVTSNPPSLLFCAVNDREGRPKDTLRNAQQTGEFVVNLVDFAHAATMVATAAPYPAEESEFARCGVPAAPSTKVSPPRVATAAAAFECQVLQVVEVGSGPLAGNIVIGRILRLHIDERVLDPEGKVDPAKLDAIGRMGGEGWYARTTDRFLIERPRAPRA